MMRRTIVDERIKKLLLVILLTGSLLLSGCGGSSDSTAKNELMKLYGENRLIDGAYDASLAAACSNGVFVGLEDNGVVSFKGIPYAEAPVGELRWRDPVPAKDSTAVHQAYYFGHSPIQTEWPTEPGSYYPQSEDCLTLNVWTNTSAPEEGKTVILLQRMLFSNEPDGTACVETGRFGHRDIDFAFCRYGAGHTSRPKTKKNLSGQSVICSRRT